MNPDDTLGTQEVAEALGMSARQVQRELEAHRLRGVRHGHAWRVPRVEVWRYLGIADEMCALWLDHLSRNGGEHRCHLKSRFSK